MSNFPILDLVAGMVFIYFLLSIICSSAVEMILTGGKYRAKMLEDWLKTIFNQSVKISETKSISLGEAIMDHCSVTALSGSGNSTAYMAATNFTSALLEKITYNVANPNSIPQDIQGYIDAIQKTNALPPELQRVFLSYAFEAKNTFAEVAIKTSSEIDLFKSKIENWFDSSMDRVGGALKTSYTRPITFIVAALTALLLNADSITIAKYLYNNPESRSKIATSAYEAAHNDKFQKQVDELKKSHPGNPKDTGITYQQINDSLSARLKDINTAKAALDDSSIPLGWAKEGCKKGDSLPLYLLEKFVGLFATFFAITMGAPFWFEVLNKIANLRGTGKKPSDSNKKNKK